MDLNAKLRQRTQESYETKDGGFSPTTFKLPDGAEMYKPQEGVNRIDILPFIRATDGEPDYVFVYYIHTDVGVENDKVVCPLKTWGKRCPICEERERMRANNADYEEYKALNPKRRTLYNVIDKQSGRSTILIWEVSHYLFERKLMEDATDDAGQLINFAALDTEGRTVRFKARKSQFNGRDVLNNFDSFVFEPRQQVYDNSAVELAYKLDSLLIPKSYDELSRMFYMMDDDSGSSPSIPVQAQPVQAAPVQATPVQAAPVQAAPVQADPMQAQPVQAAPVQAAPVQAAPVQQVCPVGGKFGDDIDKYEQCDTCMLWNACNSASVPF